MSKPKGKTQNGPVSYWQINPSVWSKVREVLQETGGNIRDVDILSTTKVDVWVTRRPIGRH